MAGVKRMRTIAFDLKEPTVLLNQWQRMHHRERTRHAHKVAWAVREAVGPVQSPPIELCEIHVDRYSSKLPDWDGLYGGLKPLLDSLVVATERNPHGLGIIEDDSPDHVLRLTATPHIARPKQGWTSVRIFEV